MGIRDIKFWKAVIISKPPDERLPWPTDQGQGAIRMGCRRDSGIALQKKPEYATIL